MSVNDSVALSRQHRTTTIKQIGDAKRWQKYRFCRSGPHRAHEVRLPGKACQPEPSSPARTAYSVWRSVFADPGIAFFDTGTAPL